MKATTLESFPPGNPFHHDAISTGIRLKDFVSIHDSEYDKPYQNLYLMYSGMFGSGMYIVNADTGERIKIEP